MPIYLPIAEMPIDMFFLLGIGAAVGFVSGLFGVGGGFLLTPLLVFAGVPSAVAVGSVSAQVAASSASGALSYWRRGAVDGRLALILLASGMVGSGVGAWVFALLRRIGQLDLFIALSYAILLGGIGAYMLVESVGAIRARRRGEEPPARRPRPRGAGRRMPFRMFFPKSRMVVSAVPIVVLGVVIGFFGTMLGIGGGFLIVPALIYLLRVPIGLVVGTSLVQMVATMAFATFLQAAGNHTVDVVLAFVLMIGGVGGAQFGASLGRRLRGEQLRVLLALLILAVGLRFVADLVLTPADVWSVARVIGGAP